MCDADFSDDSLLLQRVQLRGNTAPEWRVSNGSISVKAILDGSEYGDLGAALRGGLTVRISGAGLAAPETMVFPFPRCMQPTAVRINCIGSLGETANFTKRRTGNVFNVRIGAKQRTFSPPLASAAVQLLLSAGGLDRRDSVANCAAARSRKLMTCKH